MQGLLSSLRVRLVLLVAIAMLPAFGLIVYLGIQQRNDKREAAGREAELVTQTIVARQDQYVEGARQFLGVLVGLTGSASPDSINASSCNPALAGLLEQNPRYTDLGIADEHGTVLCSGKASPPADASQRTWFERAVETREFAIGGYQIDALTKQATVNFGYPVLDEAGQPALVVFAALDLAWLNQVAVQTDLPEDAALTIVDRNGVILARYPDPELWLGKTVPDIDLLQRSEGGNLDPVHVRGVDGVQRIFAFAPLGGTSRPEAYVRVGIATSALYAAANESLVRNLTFLGGVTALALLAAWFGGGGLVVRKVNVVLEAARRVMGGDLGARTGLTGEGELGRLGHGFDEMASALQEREAERALAEGELARRAEALVRSNTELEQFAYVASHDLQEPLRMVASYTQLLAKRYEGKLDSEADEFIRFAVDGASRMQALINDLLSLSRVGTRGAAFEETDVEQAFEACVRNLGVAIEESGAEVTHDPLPEVVGDEGQLVQLLQNLIANAIRFHGDEPPRIHVSARREGAQYVFSVQDNGIGIEPQYAERVFVLFQRLHGREAYPGTGIGLAICKKIVERHGGRIWFESERGKGATFWFTLPAAPAGILVAA